jgi:5-methylthioribose kinase
MQTLAGGVSNRTVLVRFEDGQTWVLKQALAKLRTKAEWFSDPARVHREALGMRWLAKLAPPGTIPEFVFEDFDEHLLAMHAVPQPHDNWKTMLLQRRQVFSDEFDLFGNLLGTIHRNSIARASEVAPAFADRSFFESLRIEPYYLYTAEQVPEAADFLHSLVETTRSHRLALVHGDYSPKNILVRDRKLVLLDHEVIHWGDPAFDLGFALAHLISKARYLGHDGFMTAGAVGFWLEYSRSCGDWIYDDSSAPRRINQHILACMLARVAGRSPLEYLRETDRAEQQRDVLFFINEMPENVIPMIASLAAKNRRRDGKH